MKTNVYLSLILGLATVMMMKGQNADASQPSSGSAAVQEPGKKILITLNAKNFATEEQAKSSKTSLPEITPEVSPGKAESLLKEADQITIMATALRKEAKTAQPERKSKLMQEAQDLDYIAMNKQVEASEINGKLNLKKYLSNRNVINNMIELHEGKPILNHTRYLITESEKNMKIARELRQEASAQSHLPSKLGTMSNAEEKELLALSNQNDAISMLKKTLY